MSHGLFAAEGKVMQRVCAFSLLALMFAHADIGWAHGTVGDYTFIEPIVAEDANPKNEFDILRPQETWTADGREFSLGFSMEKVLVPAPEAYSNGTPGGGLISLEVAGEWVHESPKEGPGISGFGN
ncbi:MAG TPA: hypothetical protein VJ728_10265, partial [Candidatus Binataceae bacterium]|nr:hypothetical protein [Candidatus Binataceae bacterium]